MVVVSTRLDGAKKRAKTYKSLKRSTLEVDLGEEHLVAPPSNKFFHNLKRDGSTNCGKALYRRGALVLDLIKSVCYWRGSTMQQI